MRMPKLMTIDDFTDWSGMGRTRVYGLIGIGMLRAAEPVKKKPRGALRTHG